MCAWAVPGGVDGEVYEGHLFEIHRGPVDLLPNPRLRVLGAWGGAVHVHEPSLLTNYNKSSIVRINVLLILGFGRGFACVCFVAIGGARSVMLDDQQKHVGGCLCESVMCVAV